ncbi:MAG: T9SS type A sorting domain-containing protein [Chitinophagales bacterium]
MKKIVLFLSLFTFYYGYSQSLPINFEGAVTTSDFVDFDGGTATVIANPVVEGINTSTTVARIIRDGGAVFAGSKILLSSNLDFSTLTKISMKVYTTAPVGTVVKFKLEGEGPSVDNVDAFTTTSGEWETLEWIFAGTPNNLNEIVFMFDFGNIGDGSAASTFYFDDIEQIAGPPAPRPTSLPIDFETGVVTSDFLDFSGAKATVIPNPQMNGINTSNTVCEVVRNGGEFWGGSKILLSDNLDFSTMWHISMKVYTEAPAGTRIKLELEGSSGLYNLDYVTTVSGEWETASWNFDNQSNAFNKINFIFDFGNVGDGSATSTFLFDDVEQFVGPSLPNPLPTTLPIDFEASVVSSDFVNVFGAITSVVPNPKIDEINPSTTVGQFVRSGGAPWAQSKIVLTDFMDYTTLSALSMKVYTDAPVGTLLKFKVESTESGAANEKNVFTTVSGAWETYYWDFAGDPPVYNVLTFMLGYATLNDASPNATFLFDDIVQTSPEAVSIDPLSNIEGVHCFPNPVKDHLTITSENHTIETITIFDTLGKEILVLHPNSSKASLKVADFDSGVYIAKISTRTGVVSMKLIIE